MEKNEKIHVKNVVCNMAAILSRPSVITSKACFICCHLLCILLLCITSVQDVVGRSHLTVKKRIMMTSSNGNIFSVAGHLCGEFTGHRWIPRTKASDEELWCFLWSAHSKWLSKQWRGWWFETSSPSLWRHCNGCPGGHYLDYRIDTLSYCLIHC